MTKIIDEETGPIPEYLVVRLKEILAWKKSGVGELPALQAYADKYLAGLGDVDTLRIAEDRTLLEAARFLVQMAASDE